MAAAGAGAGTENPLYRPDAKRSYAISDVSDSKHLFQARETFGYGFTDVFAIGASFGYVDPDRSMPFESGFDSAEAELSYRYLGGRVIGDVYGRYGTSMDKDASEYGKFNSYTVGTRLGVDEGGHTRAGRAEYTYVDPDLSDGVDMWKVGASWLYRFAPRFSAMLDAEYVNLDTGRDGGDSTFATIQANYHAKGTLSAYYRVSVDNDVDDSYGIKYGVQF
jgi:hypothetical protein